MSTKDSNLDPVSEVMALHDKAAIAIKRAAIQSDVDAFLDAGNARAALETRVRELEKDAARFLHLQNIDSKTAQAFFWLYAGRKNRAAAIDAALSAQKPEASNGR